MGRRDEVDPVLTEHVRERLAHLLAEQRPRRAQAASGGGLPSLLTAPPRAKPEDPAEFWPSDDEEDGDPFVQPVAAPRRAGPLPAVAPPGRDEPTVTASLSSPLPFGRAHLGVVVALLVVGLLCAGWAVLRARPVAMASPVAIPSVAQVTIPTAAPTVAKPSASPANQILVHVLGAVRRPGVVTLPQTARVRDALAAAGGLTRAAAPGELNLAQVLTDGQQIVIGNRHRPSGEVRSGASGGGTNSSGAGASPGGSAGTTDVVDLNRATEAELDNLPGVGPVTAGKIVAWRTEHGRFTRVEELQEIDGIGPKTYAEIAPRARV